MVYRDTFEEVVAYFSSQENYLDELLTAKKLFFEVTGKVFEDEPSFESRMACFVEWFILDRTMRALGMVPARAYCEVFDGSLGKEVELKVRALVSSIHSLFKYKGKVKGGLLVEDLFDRQEYKIHEKRNYVSFKKDTLFEGRIISHENEWYLSGSTMSHPFDARGPIAEMLSKRKLTTRPAFIDFVLALSACRLKYDRFQNLGIAQIYADSGEKIAITA